MPRNPTERPERIELRLFRFAAVCVLPVACAVVFVPRYLPAHKHTNERDAFGSMCSLIYAQHHYREHSMATRTWDQISDAPLSSAHSGVATLYSAVSATQRLEPDLAGSFAAARACTQRGQAPPPEAWLIAALHRHEQTQPVRDASFFTYAERLEDLAPLIDGSLAAGLKCGYRFELWRSKTQPDWRYLIVANPIGHAGELSYAINERGVVHSARRRRIPLDPQGKIPSWARPVER